MSDQSFTTTFAVGQTPEEAFSAPGTPGVPVVAGRDVSYATFGQGRYDESVRYRDFMGSDVPWYSAQDSAGALLAGRRSGMFCLVCYLRHGDRVFVTYWSSGRGVEVGQALQVLHLSEHTGAERQERQEPHAGGRQRSRIPHGATSARPETRRATAATAAALTATLGLAAASWVVAVRQMNGMDMGAATRLGSFAFFAALWVSMMAAMMLPGAVPAVLRRAHASGRVRAVPLFVGSYLAVWALVGVAVYAVYRPHGSSAAGVVAIAAGVYEFTPVKQHFRRRCRDSDRSGFEFGLCCAGSSIGLMLMLVALGIMSVTWMSVIAVLVLAQKLLPAKAAIDVPLALAIVGLGIWIVIAPASVPGLTPLM